MPSFSTKAIHGGGKAAKPEGALRTPVYNSVAFEFDSAADMQKAFAGKLAHHAYSRITNPTVQELERRVCLLSDSLGAIAVSSGMAAIANVLLAIAGTGTNIITTQYLFGNTRSLFSETFSEWGLEIRFADMTDPSAVCDKTDAATRAIFLEAITNPQLEIADIGLICEKAASRGIPVIVDTTLVTPYLFRAREAGVAVEILSSTKYLSGGATSVGGLIIDTGAFDWSKNPKCAQLAQTRGPYALLAKLRTEVYRNAGACLSPHAAWLQLLGLETLALRIDKSCANALAVARFLAGHPGVASVNYPGLENAPFHEQAARQFTGQFGALLTFSLKDREQCFSLIDKLAVIRRATNFNDNKSLIIHPASTIYAEFSAEQRLHMGVPDELIRLGVGIEDPEDIIADLSQALEAL